MSQRPTVNAGFVRGAALVALPLLFFALFYFYPLAAIIRISLAPDGRLALDALSRLVSSDYYARTLWFTTWQAVVSTLLTVGLALPAAYIFATYRFRGREALRTLSTLPFVLPTIVVANAFTALLGSRGLLNNWFVARFDLAQPPIRLDGTLALILLAHVFYNYSVALRIISSYWQNVGRAPAEAAQMLGASPLRVFWSVTLPLLRPAIAAAGVLIFIFTFTSFGVILILGGARFATLEVEIYRQAVDLFNLPIAAALSLLQIGLTAALLWLYARTQGRMPAGRARAAAHLRRPARYREHLLIGVNLVLLLVLLGAPLLALVARSLLGADGPTLAFYRQLLVNERGSALYIAPMQAVVNSLTIAGATTLLAVALGLIAAQTVARSDRRTAGRSLASLLDAFYMLPLATSAVTLGFGFVVALGSPPLNLRASPLLLPIAHTLVALPFVVRAVLPALRAVDPALREAAALLGAPPGRVWRTIEWPLIRRAVVVGAVFAFTISMGEFGATVFVARPQTATLPVAIFRFLSQPGALNYGQALAMSTILMLVCAVGFAVIERFRLGDEGSF